MPLSLNPRPRLSAATRNADVYFSRPFLARCFGLLLLFASAGAFAQTAPTGTIDSPSGNQTIGTGETVNFTGSFTEPEGDMPYSFQWDFNGGATDVTVEDPGDITFNTPGVYTVIFTVSDNLDGADPAPPQVVITVADRPESTIDGPATDQVIATGDAVNFSGTGTDAGANTPLTFQWDFDSGATNTTAEDPGNITFNTPGVYNVTFTATNSLGLEDLSPATVQITVTDAPDGAIDSPAAPLTVNAGDSVTFAGTASDPDNTNPLTVVWDFNGGATNSTLEDPGAVQFDTPGVYTVTFTVTDNLGIEDPTPASVVVTVNAAPDGAIDLPASGPVAVNQGDPVTFDGSYTDADTNPPYTFLWDFNGAAADATVEDPGAVAITDTFGSVTVSFTVTDGNGFADPTPATIQLDINGAPDGTITTPVGATLYLEPTDTFSFQTNATDPENNTPFTYAWDFDGGASNTTDANPADVAFDTPGTYNATFSVTDSNGATDLTPAALTIVVTNFPESVIDTPAVGTIAIGNGESLTFTGTGSDPDNDLPLTYLWDFDGAFPDSTLEDPGMLTFNTNGVYTVNFTVSDAVTAPDPTPAQVVVTVSDRPATTIDSPASSLTIVTGSTINFMGSVIDDGDPGDLTYNWNFDGAAADATTLNPDVTFTTPGSYDVVFNATDINNLSDLTPATITVTVTDAPDSTITAPASNQIIVVGDSVSFAGNGSDGDNSVPFTYQWDFNGGASNSTAQNPGAVTFNSAGVYNVSFTVTDAFGVADPTPATVTITVTTRPNGVIDSPATDQTIATGDSVSFSATITDADNSTPLTQVWDFNGGASNSTLEDPGPITFNTPGVYVVTLTATDNLGVSDDTPATVTITVTDPPDGTIDSPVGDQVIAVGQALNFTATASDPDNNTPLSFLWGFDGGAANSLLEDPGNVTFNTPGDYTVTFTVTDNLGIEDPTPATINVRVTNRPDGVIDSPVGNQTIATGATLNFTATVTDADNTTPFTFAWDFDGAVANSTLEDPGDITFSTPGVYTIVFTATDALGIADDTPASLTVTVTDAPESTIDAPVGEQTILVGESVTFNGTGTDNDNNTPFTYQWDFDGGATASTVEDPGDITFSTAGVYDVTFTVTDSNGIADPTPATVRINVTFAPETTIDTPVGNQLVPVNTTLNFTGSVSDADQASGFTYLWNFDGAADDATVEDPGDITFSSSGTYNVSFTATDSFGVSDATPATVQIVVNDPPQGTISSPNGNRVIGVGQAVNFLGSVTDTENDAPFTYLWDFDGAAADSTVEDPGSITFSNAGVYTVTFTVTDALGQADPDPATVVITVNNAPQSVIDSPNSTTTIPVGGQVTFAGTGTDSDNNTPLSYRWTFDGAFPDNNLEDPGLLTFNTGGTYNVTFTVTDSLGLADPTPATVTIVVSGAPDGIIDAPSVNPTFIRPGQAVVFQGSVADPDRNSPFTYLWNFGGGATNSTLQDPGSVPFNTPGVYDVTFTVTDNLGLVDPLPASVRIVVSEAPEGTITAPTENQIIATGSAVTFSSSATDSENNTPFSFAWDFAGGAANSTDQNPGAVTFNTPGTYPVTLTVTDSVGAVDATPATVQVRVTDAPQTTIDLPAGNVNIAVGSSVTFNGTAVDPDGNTPLTYRWDFDGVAAASTLEDPGPIPFNTVGTYTITFNATDSLGISDATPATITVTVTEAPNSTILTPATTTIIATGATVNFTGSGSDPDNNLPLTYAWDFAGGAANSTEQNPGDVAFNTPGDYVVRFTVADALGVTDATPATVTVRVTDPPNGTITAPSGNVSINVGETVTFTATFSDPDNTSPFSYQWDFAGGAPNSTAQNPGAVRFNNAGVFNVTFTVTDALGIADPTPATVTVNVGDDPNGTILTPAANVVIGVGETVNFTGQGADPGGNTPLSYLWDFGGGATDSNVENPGDIAFDTIGVYQVSFVVTNSLGLADPTPPTRTITVGARPEGTIDSPTEARIIALGETINFSATITDSDANTPFSYLWDFDGAAANSNLEDPGNVIFNTAGVYDITFTATDSLGLSDLTPATVQVTVSTPPEGTIVAPAENVVIGPGESVTFTGSSSDVDGHTPITHRWSFDGAAADSTLQSPGPIPFANEGIYTVTYTATDSLGIADPSPANVQVTVAARPDSVIEQPSGNVIIAAGATVTFAGNGNDDNGNTPLRWLWTFDGVRADSTQRNPGAVRFENIGEYRVRLQAINSLGLADNSPAEVVVRVTNAPNGQITSPSERVVGVLPGGSVNFAGVGTDLDDNLPLTFVWDFDGGAPNTTQRDPGNVQFDSAGVFNVTFTVTDGLGIADPTPATVIVVVGNEVNGFIDKPVSSAIINPGSQVDFAGTGADPNNQVPLTYLWTFAGAAPDSTLEDPGLITFDTAGVYQIRFTVTNNVAVSDPTPPTRTIIVNDPPTGTIDAPTGDLTIAAGQSVTFAATASDPNTLSGLDPDTNLRFLWDFDGGAPDAEVEDPGPVTFNEPGIFDITLTITDSRGAVDPTPHAVRVVVGAAPDGTIDEPADPGPGNVIAINLGDTVVFAGTGEDPQGQTPLTFLWDFNGAAANSTLEDPGPILFNQNVNTDRLAYEVTFTVTNALELPDPIPARRTIVVNRPPTAASLNIRLADTDTEGRGNPQVVDLDIADRGRHTFEILTQPAIGTIELDNNTFVYTPVAGQRGEFTFDYRITDPGGFTIDATGAVTVFSSAIITQLIASWPNPPIVDCFVPGSADCNDIDTLVELINNPDTNRLGKNDLGLLFLAGTTASAKTDRHLAALAELGYPREDWPALTVDFVDHGQILALEPFLAVDDLLADDQTTWVVRQGDGHSSHHAFWLTPASAQRALPLVDGQAWSDCEQADAATRWLALWVPHDAVGSLHVTAEGATLRWYQRHDDQLSALSPCDADSRNELYLAEHRGRFIYIAVVQSNDGVVQSNNGVVQSNDGVVQSNDDVTGKLQFELR